MTALVLGGVSAVINLVIGGLSLYFSKAPGWRYYRTFSFVCILFSAYAICDVLTLHLIDDGLVAEPLGRTKVFLAIVAAFSMLLFNRQQARQKLSRYDIVLGATLLPLALAALIPGVCLHGHDPIYIPSMDLSYNMPRVTWMGAVAMGIAVVCVLTVAVRYFRAAIHGTRADWGNAFGYSILVVFSIEEVLVMARVLAWPLMLHLGVAGLVLLVLVDLSSKVVRSSLVLQESNKTLEERVRWYSKELADTQEELFIAERQVALEQLAAGIGHEINNPLTSVGGNLQFILDSIRDDQDMQEECQAVEESLEGVERIHQIVCDLTLSTIATDTQDTCDPSRAVSIATRLIEPKYRKMIEFSLTLRTESWVAIGESKLSQVLLNLLTNAAHAVEESGRPESSTVGVLVQEYDDKVQIDVIDSGGGVDPSKVHRIFDPLFTTKEVGRGTGLGLFVSRSIVDIVGGSLVLAKSSDTGSTMRVLLPIASSGDSTRVVEENDSLGDTEEGLGLRVYLVDDEPMVTRAIERMTKKYQFVVENDSRVALEHLLGGAEYDVILCDLMMPQLSGMELYRKVTSARPDLCKRFAFITGGAITNDAQEFIELPTINVLAKPLGLEALQEAIGQAHKNASSD